MLLPKRLDAVEKYFEHDPRGKFWVQMQMIMWKKNEKFVEEN